MKYCSIWANLFLVVVGKTSNREKHKLKGYLKEKEKENKTLNTLLHVQFILSSELTYVGLHAITWQC